MDAAARRLRDALLSGYGAYVRARIAGLGPEPDRIAEAIREGEAILASELDGLLAAPVNEQTATPLEVFRAALDPVAAALAAAGVAPPSEPAAAPSDPYQLVPASAAEVSGEAGEAAMAWGMDKASRMVRPLAIAVTGNLIDLSSLEAAAARAGYDFEARSDASGERSPAAAFVDLEDPGADEAIRVLSGAGVRVVAYGPHVDSFAMTRARSLGAAVAEPRSRVFRDPAAFLLPVV